MRNIQLETEGDTTRGRIIPFPDAAARQPRSAQASDERSGVILLFTGVRYERVEIDGPTPPVASNGSRRRRS